MKDTIPGSEGPIANGQLSLIDGLPLRPETSQDAPSGHFPTEVATTPYDYRGKTQGQAKRQKGIARALPPKEARRFDKTALHYNSRGGTVSHADYLAHCEKYDYCFRQIAKGDKILDIGCGTDQPLVKAITKDMTKATGLLQHGGGYVGADLNAIKRKMGYAWATIVDEVDATDPDNYQRLVPRISSANHWAFGEYTMGVCLEVIEHMDVPDGRRLLETFWNALAPGGRLYLSTPVFDGHMARNHVHEYEIPELQELIESVGFVVDRRMGTFTSEPIVKRWLKENHPDWLEVYMASREFHTSGYMSGLFAPMLPDQARNNVWDLRKP